MPSTTPTETTNITASCSSPNTNNQIIQNNSKEEKCLIELRNLIKESGDNLLLKNTWDFTDEFLLRYIRSRNYQVDSAFDRLQNHMYVRRVKNPEIFARLYPSAVYHALSNGGAVVLKNRDEFNRHVIYARPCTWDPDEIPLDDMLLAVMMLGWEMLSFKETQLNGIVIILDGRGFSIKHAKQGTPNNIQKYADLILRASPFKCKGAHIIYAPMIFNMTLSLIKMFLPHKLRRRIHVHGSNPESLHKFISPEILPELLGGYLTEAEAEDTNLIEGLKTKEKDDYYKSFCV